MLPSSTVSGSKLVMRQAIGILNSAARLVIAVLVAGTLGCSSVKIPPPYTQQELKLECERHHSRWHEDNLRGGFCEPDSRG
jgi:hypothetical protein